MAITMWSIAASLYIKQSPTELLHNFDDSMMLLILSSASLGLDSLENFVSLLTFPMEFFKDLYNQIVESSRLDELLELVDEAEQKNIHQELYPVLFSIKKLSINPALAKKFINAPRPIAHCNLFEFFE